MALAVYSSVAHKPAASPAQRAGPQFLKSRRSALQRETPSRGNLLYTQALQLARLQDHEEAARTAFEECCKAEPDNTKVVFGVRFAALRRPQLRPVPSSSRPFVVMQGLGVLGSVREAGKEAPTGQVSDVQTSAAARTIPEQDQCCPDSGIAIFEPEALKLLVVGVVACSALCSPCGGCMCLTHSVVCRHGD